MWTQILAPLIGRSVVVCTRSGARYSGQLRPTDSAGVVAIDVPGGRQANKPYRVYLAQDSIEAVW